VVEIERRYLGEASLGKYAASIGTYDPRAADAGASTSSREPMSLTRRFRELLAGPDFLVMPGAYDALSARLIEAQGFQAITAGGYSAMGTMLAQPDMGQSNMRDYADHYGRSARR
jgi:hypothetical protein